MHMFDMSQKVAPVKQTCSLVVVARWCFASLLMKLLIGSASVVSFCKSHHIHIHQMLIYFILIYNVSLTGLLSCVHNVKLLLVWYLDHQGVTSFTSITVIKGTRICTFALSLIFV